MKISQHLPCCHILTDLTVMPRSLPSPHVGNHWSLAFQKSLAADALPSTQGLLNLPSLRLISMGLHNARDVRINVLKPAILRANGDVQDEVEFLIEGRDTIASLEPGVGY